MKDHPKEQVFGDIGDGELTWRNVNEFLISYAFISLIEPKNLDEAISYQSWVIVMQEEG